MQVGDKVQAVKDIKWSRPRYGRNPAEYFLRPQYTYTVSHASRDGKWLLVSEYKPTEQPCLSTNDFRVVGTRKPVLQLVC